MSLAVESLPVIADPITNRPWVSFPDGQTIPLDKLTELVNQTYQERDDETLVGLVKLLGNLNDQAEEILAGVRASRAERDNT